MRESSSTTRIDCFTATPSASFPSRPRSYSSGPSWHRCGTGGGLGGRGGRGPMGGGGPMGEGRPGGPNGAPPGGVRPGRLPDLLHIEQTAAAVVISDSSGAVVESIATAGGAPADSGEGPEVVSG